MFERQQVDRIERDVLWEARVDEALNDAGQQWIAQAVKRLPGDEPSMAWRAALNGRLAAEAARHVRRRRFQFVWRPVFALAAAGALMLLFVPRQGMNHAADVPRANATIESAIAAAHMEAARGLELGATQVIAHETRGEVAPASQQWEEADLGAF